MPAQSVSNKSNNWLAPALQVAFEAAVLPNRFEIDEQSPGARLEALFEQALLETKIACSSAPVEDRVAAISAIGEVTERIRAALRGQASK